MLKSLGLSHNTEETEQEVCACNPSTQEREDGGSVAQVTPWLCVKFEPSLGYVKL